MSRRKDGGFPRRKGGNCNKPLRTEGGTKQESFGGTDVNRPSTSKGHQHSKPPPGLKGKALGLWFRDRQVKRNIEFDKKAYCEVRLPQFKFKEIEDLLFNVGPIKGMSNLMVDGEFKDDFFKNVQGSFEENLAKMSCNAVIKNESLDNRLKTGLDLKMRSKSYQEMLSFRERLPSYKMRSQLIDIIEKNQLVVISGETGCGKTTQIAQFILDDYSERGIGSTCSIICTQPRRISAITVAERVAAERDEPLGESVGYQIRLDKKLPERKQGTILFVTTGILLQWIHSNPSLNGISHLFLDEVHERDILCDFVITFLKFIAPKRPKLKIILMSATLNAERFSAYYGGIPCIEIPGFSFPVEEIYLPKILSLTNFQYPEAPPPRKWMAKIDDIFSNYIIPHVRQLVKEGHISSSVGKQLTSPHAELLNIDLIERLIRHICLNEGDGAILVFLPGLTDISALQKQLLSRQFFNNQNYVIYPLHSILPTINQKGVFSRPRPGVRKIIIATNIAETSITIDDVVFVIDPGFIKMSDFNMTVNVSTLESRWVSLANARQRRGRAGRVQAGKCYRLYTKAREEVFEHYPAPEMQRKRLEEVVLQAKLLQLGRVAPFLEKVMDPPDPKAVSLAVEVLRNLNAIDEEERLTPLGFHLAKLPMDPQTGKMILMAAIFGCVDPIFSIAAALAFKDPFHIPLNREEEVKQRKLTLINGNPSDHLVLSAAIMQWERACRRGEGNSFCWEHFMSGNTLNLLKDMKGQFARHLMEMKFLRSQNPQDKNGNINSNNSELVKAIVCSGLYPNVAMIKNKKGSNVLLKTKDHPRVQLHPRSIVLKTVTFESPFLVYHTILKSSSIYLHDATCISPWALLFFGERLDVVEFEGVHGIRVDELIKINCFKKTAMLIKKLRSHLHWILANAVSNPEVIDWDVENNKTAVLKAIVELITAENEERMDIDKFCRDS